MPRAPLTEIAMKALAVVQARSAKEGLSFFEELNRVGLIATEPRIQEIEVAALRNARDRLYMITPDQLLARFRSGNSNPATALDMLYAVQEWLDGYILQVETG